MRGSRRGSGPSAAAWGAIALTAASIALSWWWLAEDRGIPGLEPGTGLTNALATHAALLRGDLLVPVTAPGIHPPLVGIVGAIGMLIGGVNVSAPIVAEVLVFVPLLALGCYRTAALVAGPRAGVLAVAFALGTPLIVESFHVLMLDAPDAALVAIAVWLILASDRFRRTRTAALAGLVVGFGLLTKQQFALCTAGLVAIVALRAGGWRHWRGLAAFALGALLVAGPWYIDHLEHLGVSEALIGTIVPGTDPPTLSLANLGWYLWAALNGELLAPLFGLVAIGIATATVQTLRGRAGPWVPELLAGLLLTWIALMATPIHVVRYQLPAIVYLAVLGTIWMVQLRPLARSVAVAALALAITASVLGSTFGVGGAVRVALVRHLPTDRTVMGVAPTDQVVLHTNRVFELSGPRRGDDLLALLRAMRRNGIQTVSWLPSQDEPYDYDHAGIDILIAMAGMGTLPTFDPGNMPPGAALLIRDSLPGVRPCARMAGGHDVWLRRGGVPDARVPAYCPARSGA
jgi:4-amino-4-deoxy-L-arabinose transferase-like glycosyltransferase